MYLQNPSCNAPQLLKKYKKGDRNAFEVLVKRYLQPIYSFVHRFVGDSRGAEDVTQDVFVKAWKNARKFDTTRSFKTWLFSIAKNASLDFLKKKKTIPFSAFDDEEGRNFIEETIADQLPLPQEIMEKTDDANALNLVLEKLSPKYRIVLFLRYNDHFTFREIAESLSTPLHTVKSWHQRGVKMLRGIFGNRVM